MIINAGTVTTNTIPAGAVLQLNGVCECTTGGRTTYITSVGRLGPYLSAVSVSINAISDVRVTHLSQESRRDFGYPGNINNVVSFEFATDADSLMGPFEKGDLYKVAFIQATSSYKILTDVDAISWAVISSPGPDLIFVSGKDNLPAAVAGVITLAAGITYYFTRTVDLLGARLVAGANTVILGSSSENSRIKSTGLAAGTALITSQYTMPVRHITLEHNTILNLDPGAPSNEALDWYGVNFEGATNIGRIANYNNVIITSTAFLNSYGLTLDGTIGTAAITDGFLQSSVGTIITIPATATIQRRFRLLNSSIIASGSATGLNVNASASIPSEGYILTNINFSGGGTYTTGVAGSDNKSRWNECRGVANSDTVAWYTMDNNATATVIASTAPVKVAGVTVLNSVSQRFTHTNNRATYAGSLTRSFGVFVNASATGTAGHQVTLYIAKNGTPITLGAPVSTLNAAGRAENIAAQAIVSLATNDFIEVWVSNGSSADVTIPTLNLIAEARQD